jgi:exonuclease III
MNNLEQEYNGRPYGGVAIICRKTANLIWQEIELENDRLIDVTLSDSIGLRQVIINTYMPYFESASSGNIVSFIECLDGLQACLDKYGPIARVKICSDFNAQLPSCNTLSRYWHRSKGNTQQSKLLYDFISSMT